MDENSQMPFGKYVGLKMKDVPKDYCLYLYRKRIININNWNRVYWYVRKFILKNENEEILL